MLDQDKDGETASTCGSASDLENDKEQQVSVPGRTLDNDGLMEQASVPGCTRGLIIKRQWIDKILAHQKVAWII
jgi:hypothetical protein